MDDRERILEKLNPEQAEAVRHCDRHLLILAGAGTGKTRVITHKVAWLVEVLGARPWEIMAVTFTNKAAGEIKERVARMLGERFSFEKNDWPYFGTFHSQGLRMVRRHADLLGLDGDLTICDDEDQVALVKRVLTELDVDPKQVPPKQVAAFIDGCKNRFQYPEDLSTEGFASDDSGVQVEAYRRYQKRLRDANGVDFGDLICLPVKLLKGHPEIRSYYQFHLKYVLVDEFQDTNTAQYLWLRELASEKNLITVVGDDDQSIYRWRGADVGNILSFPRDFPDARVVRLEQNYRSTGHILATASAMIRQNQRRHEKTLRPVRDEGHKVVLVRAVNELDEVRFVVARLKKLRDALPLSEMAVLYRTNAQSRVFEETLQRERIPYRIFGGVRFYERAEVKDALAYARLVVNPRDDLSFQRVLNNPPRGVGGVSVDRLVERAGMLGMPLYAAARDAVRSGLVKGKGARGVEEFVGLIDALRVELADASASEVLRTVLTKSGYRTALEDEQARGSLDAEARLENLDELVASATSFEREATQAGIRDFLDHVGLMTAVDLTAAGDGDSLSLMSVHNAKGLEFAAVFVVGVEEGYFPHFNARNHDEEIEEERRLLYVAFTRAKDRLYVSYALTRSRYAGPEGRLPSRFLAELPETSLDRGRPSVSPGAPPRPTPQAGGLTPGWMLRPARDATPQEPAADAQRVQHPAFGIGVVLGEEGHGPTRRVTVRFQSVGTVKLPAKQVRPA